MIQPLRCRTAQIPPFTARFQRQGAYRYQWRAFSATQHRRDSVLDIVTFIPRGYMDVLHHYLYLPWWVAIPLTAATMRATLSYFPTKKIWENNNMAVALQPLITVSTYAARRAQNIDGRRAQTMAEISAQRDIVSSVRQDIGQDFRINDSIKNTLYNFVVFVIGAEAVRSKLGLEQGLLGLMWSAVQYPFQRLLQDAPALGAKTSAASTTSVVPLEQELDILANLEPPIPASFDPTTLVGGPFWCTDLSLADPTGAMAYLTAAIIGLNVLLRPSRASAKTMREWLETLSLLEVIQLLFVPVFMIIGVRIPAGILLYTMWSVLSTKIMNVYFGIRNPRPRVIKPCTSFAPRMNKRAT